MSGMLIDKTQSAVYLKNYFRNVFSFTTNSNEFNYALEPFFRGKNSSFLIRKKNFKTFF